MDWTNKLYFGDNLDILRHHVPNESVDLIYLDPPFNSKATYNVLFRERNGTDSAAQITAFDDFWHWDMEAARAFHDVVTTGPQRVADLLEALRRFLGQNDMMAYLTMMAIRLVELHRVLKPTGSIYLHCDPTANSGLRLLLDAIFGVDKLRNEIVWQRTSAHSRVRRFGPVHDTLLFYTRSETWTWNQQFAPYDQDYVNRFYRYVEEGTGRRYRLSDLTSNNPGGSYLWKGQPPPSGRYWGYSEATMERFEREGRLVYTPGSGVPAYKRYLDEMPGRRLQDVWTDIPPIGAHARERLGYPTQKPEALLERILRASSNEGDVVLDPFCGCGTTVAVAERLHRRWIGIDITHLAITLIKNRLQDAFGSDLSPYEVLGEPRDLPSARTLAEQSRHQFQYWALGLVGARPAGEPTKGADKGIDGRIYFFDDESGKARRVILQVKSGHVSVAHVRDLKGVLEREKAEIGALITLEEPTRPMCEEAAAAGFYDPVAENAALAPAVPRLQILTIEELLSGKKLEYPSVATATFRRAVRQRKAKRQTPPDDSPGPDRPDADTPEGAL